MSGAQTGTSAAVARVVNDNGPHNTATVEIICDPPTLEVGTVLQRQPVVDNEERLSRALCNAIHALSLAVHDEEKREAGFYEPVFAEAEAALALAPSIMEEGR